MSEEEMFFDIVRKSIRNSMNHYPITQETIILILMLKQYEKLEEIRCCIIDVEQEVAKLNSLYK